MIRTLRVSKIELVWRRSRAVVVCTREGSRVLGLSLNMSYACVFGPSRVCVIWICINVGNDWGCRSWARGTTTIAIGGLGVRLFRRTIGVSLTMLGRWVSRPISPYLLRISFVVMSDELVKSWSSFKMDWRSSGTYRGRHVSMRFICMKSDHSSPRTSRHYTRGVN